MRLLVCGDRWWDDEPYLYRVLDRFHMKYNVTYLIEGEAPGADSMAREWAKSRGIEWKGVPAEWERYRKPGRRNPAGPIRNQKMLDEEKPEVVLAFHRNPSVSKGTKHMVKIADEAGVPWMWLPSGDRSTEFLRET